jgi:hypothetical protein
MALCEPMIIETKNKNIKSQGIAKQESCSIDQEDMRYIASLLRNNYSNPLLATIREIVANALDVTKKKKVSIQLPTKIEPNFIVRDYGCGLSEEDMLGLYTKYGKSTKRESNESIGGFGIGRFAPLSYTDSFIVRSVYRGHKHSYIIRVDEHDDTIVSQIESKIDSESHDGIYVQVGIKKDDISEFFKIFKKTLWYRKDAIELLNESWGNKAMGKAEESNEIFDLYSENRYWEDKSHYGDQPYILMGGIPYKVNQHDDWFMFKQGVVYKAEIGEFKLHHSRESLEYNPQVKDALKKASQKMFDKLNSELGKQMEQAENFYEASDIMNKALSTYRQRFGTKLSISCKKFKDVSGELFPRKWIQKSCHITTRENGNLSFSNSRYNHCDWTPSDDTIYIVDDSPSPRSPKARCLFLHDWEKEKGVSGKIVLLTSEYLKTENIGATQETIDYNAKCLQRVKECNHPNVKLLSECERKITARQKTKSSVKSLSAMDILKFGTPIKQWGSEEYYNNDEWWGIDAEADLDDDSKTYYYVRYYANKVKFKPFDGYASDDEMRPFIFKSSWLNQIADFTKKNTLWGVRSNQLSKIKDKDNWVCLDDVYEDLLFDDKKVSRYVQYYEENPLFNDYCTKTMSDLDKFPKDTMNEILKNLLESYMGWIGNKVHANKAPYNHQYVLDRLKSRNLSSESSARKTAFDKAYPMAKYALEKSQNSPQNISDVLAYIG